MNLDDRLTEAFHAKAATARTSPEAFTVIRDRVRRQRRLRMLEVAGATVALPAIIAIAFVVTRPAREPQVVDTPPVTSTPSPAPSPTVLRTDIPLPTEPPVPAIPPPTGPPNKAGYADAIAVARAGIVEVITPSGTSLGWFPIPKGSQVGRLEWSPDRTEVYVSTTSQEGDCDAPQAIAVNVTSRKTRALGAWSDFAFSSDGSQLAAIETPVCGGASSLLVRNLVTGDERRLGAATGDSAAAGFGSLAWVPGVDRVVLVQHGIGDSTFLWLVDLAKAKSINDGTLLDLADGERGETVAAATYAGNRLIVALVCCLNETDRLRLVERIGATGEVRGLLSVPNQWAYQLDASPDGKRLAYAPYGAGPLWVWDFAGDPKKIADDVAAIAW